MYRYRTNLSSGPILPARQALLHKAIAVTEAPAFALTAPAGDSSQVRREPAGAARLLSAL